MIEKEDAVPSTDEKEKEEEDAFIEVPSPAVEVVQSIENDFEPEDPSMNYRKISEMLRTSAKKNDILSSVFASDIAPTT